MSFDSLEDEAIIDSDIDTILEELDELSGSSGEIGVCQARDELDRVVLIQERLESLIDEYESADDMGDLPVTDQLQTEFNTILAALGLDKSTISFESAEPNLRMLTVDRLLNSAINVTQESWSVKDLWDSAGAVERNAAELKAGLKALDGLKGWYNENAVIINSVGLLTYFTVNNKRVESISRAVNHSAEVIDKTWAIADQTMSTFEAMEKAMLASKPTSEEDVRKLLDEVLSASNPAAAAFSQLSNAVTMGNQQLVVTSSTVANPTQAELGQWSGSARVKLVTMGATPTRASTRFARIPAWVAGFLVGGQIGAAAGAAVAGVVGNGITKGAVVATGAVLTGLVYGSASVAGMDALSTGLKEKHFVDKQDMDSGLKSVLKAAEKAANHRRKYPNVWRTQTKAIDELIKHTDAVEQELTGEARKLYRTLVGVVKNTHRFGWETATVAFDLSRMMVTGANSTVAKLVKAAKR